MSIYISKLLCISHKLTIFFETVKLSYKENAVNMFLRKNTPVRRNYFKLSRTFLPIIVQEIYILA
jgi:hypothetical protein